MAKLIYANTHNSDMLYAVRVGVPDPFFFLDDGRKQYVFLDHREFGVFKEENKKQNIELVLVNPFMEEAGKIEGEGALPSKLALHLLQTYGLKEETIEVPSAFPLDMADFLRSKGINLKVAVPFWPERLQKSAKEVEAIRDSLQRTHHAFQRIEEILKNSVIDNDKILYNNEALTSEFLKAEAERILLEHDMLNTEGIIISCSEQAAIPHHRGHGSIRPHETVVCDIFPRNRTTGYFADMTRTYVKGEPSEDVKKMYQAVKTAQEKGIAIAKLGVTGGKVHEVCVQAFVELGYDPKEGFLHGTGHGIGLDIHEEPYARAGSETVLQPGNVISVEPGLYYPKLGGVRLEDLVCITENGCENLTNYPKEFIIP